MLFPVGIFPATGDDAPLTVPLPNQRLDYSELVLLRDHRRQSTYGPNYEFRLPHRS